MRLTIPRVAFPAALAAMLVAIWMLTVQTPTQTIALSDTWAHALMAVSALSYADASWVARKVVHAVEFFPVGLFLTLSVMAWAPALEKDAVASGPGKSASGNPATSSLPPNANQPASRSRALLRRPEARIALCCLALSLADQIHKAFVPGREFDALDMCFDAMGYLLAIWVAKRLGAKLG